jgi:hypothetical protein
MPDAEQWAKPECGRPPKVIGFEAEANKWEEDEDAEIEYSVAESATRLGATIRDLSTTLGERRGEGRWGFAEVRRRALGPHSSRMTGEHGATGTLSGSKRDTAQLAS